MSGLERYRYPARTPLRSAFLRGRLDRRIEWRDPALQSSHWDGMSIFVQATINAPAQPLASVLQVHIPSVGSQVDEESFEAEPESCVECRPGGSSSKRPASPERTESAPTRERHSVHPTSVAEDSEEMEMKMESHRRKPWEDER